MKCFFYILFFSVCLRSYSYAQVPVLKSDSIINIQGQKFYIHTVQKKQTLYSISKTYGVSLAIIQQHNPSVTSGLSENQYLKIPIGSSTQKTQVSTPSSATPANTTPQQAATIPALIIPPIFNISKADSVLNIVILLPLYIPQSQLLNFLPDSEIKESSHYKPFSFIGFLEGTLMAIDSMKRNGLKINVTILDEYEDSTIIKNYFKHSDMAYADLLIGPFYNASLNIASRYVKQRNTSSRPLHMIPPMVYGNEIIKDNPTVIKTSPSLDQQLLQLANFIHKDTIVDNLLILNSNNSVEKKYANTFKTEIQKVNIDSSVKNIKNLTWNPMSVSNWANFKNNLSTTKPNTIVIFVNNEAMISNMIRLTFEYKDYQMRIYGLPTWMNYESIDLSQLQQLNTHLFATSFFDYYDSSLLPFIQNYSHKYHQIPNKYAIQGFDITWMILQTIENNKINISKLTADSFQHKGYHTSFDFIQSINNGLENSYITIYKFENFRMKKSN